MTQDQSASRNWRELKETFDAIADGPHFNFVAVPKEDWRTISAALSELTQSEPPYGLLVSIALRLDHSLFLRSEISGETEEEHKRRIEIALLDARRAWEECTGHGFYRPEREAEYANHLGLDKRFERNS